MPKAASSPSPLGQKSTYPVDFAQVRTLRNSEFNSRNRRGTFGRRSCEERAVNHAGAFKSVDCRAKGTGRRRAHIAHAAVSLLYRNGIQQRTQGYNCTGIRGITAPAGSTFTNPHRSGLPRGSFQAAHSVSTTAILSDLNGRLVMALAKALRLVNFKLFLVGVHRGIVDSAICRAVQPEVMYCNLAMARREEMNLEDALTTQAWCQAQLPEVEEKGEGVHANRTSQAHYRQQNLKSQNHLIEVEVRLSELVVLINEWFAINRIACIKLCRMLCKQHHALDAISLMPANLYRQSGSNHPENSHVMAAMFTCFHKANVAKATHNTCKFCGMALLKLIHFDDVVDALLYFLQHMQIAIEESTQQRPVSVSSTDLSIQDLGLLAAETARYSTKDPMDLSKLPTIQKEKLDFNPPTKTPTGISPVQ